MSRSASATTSRSESGQTQQDEHARSGDIANRQIVDLELAKRRESAARKTQMNGLDVQL